MRVSFFFLWNQVSCIKTRSKESEGVEFIQVEEVRQQGAHDKRKRLVLWMKSIMPAPPPPHRHIQNHTLPSPPLFSHDTCSRPESAKSHIRASRAEPM